MPSADHRTVRNLLILFYFNKIKGKLIIITNFPGVKRDTTLDIKLAVLYNRIVFNN
jgi:hypothetical protein